MRKHNAILNALWYIPLAIIAIIYGIYWGVVARINSHRAMRMGGVRCAFCRHFTIPHDGDNLCDRCNMPWTGVGAGMQEDRWADRQL